VWMCNYSAVELETFTITFHPVLPRYIPALAYEEVNHNLLRAYGQFVVSTDVEKLILFQHTHRHTSRGIV